MVQSGEKFIEKTQRASEDLLERDESWTDTMFRRMSSIKIHEPFRMDTMNWVKWFRLVKNALKILKEHPDISKKSYASLTDKKLYRMSFANIHEKNDIVKCINSLDVHLSSIQNDK